MIYCPSAFLHFRIVCSCSFQHENLAFFRAFFILFLVLHNLQLICYVLALKLSILSQLQSFSSPFNYSYPRLTLQNIFLLVYIYTFYQNFFILLIPEREERREKEREKNAEVREKPISMHPNQGQNPQPWHVPWQGTELTTFRFAGQCRTN